MDKMVNLKIRQIQHKDLRKLAEIYCDVYTAFDVGERWTKRPAYKLLEYWLKRQPDLAFLAEYEGKIVGAFVTAIKPWWDGNHLFDGELFVHPDYQKRGIGAELSKHIYRAALRKYKVVRFDAHTFKQTEFPLQWYLSQGFEEIQEWTMISGDLKRVLKKLERKHL